MVAKTGALFSIDQTRRNSIEMPRLRPQTDAAGCMARHRATRSSQGKMSRQRRITVRQLSESLNSLRLPRFGCSERSSEGEGSSRGCLSRRRFSIVLLGCGCTRLPWSIMHAVEWREVSWSPVPGTSSGFALVLCGYSSQA